jgi:hypothetical protein
MKRTLIPERTPAVGRVGILRDRQVGPPLPILGRLHLVAAPVRMADASGLAGITAQRRGGT